MEEIGENKDVFTLRFYDEGANSITPESFSVKELGQLLVSIEEAVVAIILDSDPNSEAKRYGSGLSLVGIENKSESLKFKSTEIEGAEAFENWGRSYNPDTLSWYIGKPKKTFEKLRRITKSKRCNVELHKGDVRIFGIDGNLKIPKKPDVIRNVETTIYGVIEKIGGSNPRAWLKLDTGNSISFPIDIPSAQELSANLYKKVGVRGIAQWNATTQVYTSFQFKKLTYTPNKLGKATREFRETYNGFWNTKNSDEEILTYLREDESLH